jgi:hypothetical protein
MVLLLHIQRDLLLVRDLNQILNRGERLMSVFRGFEVTRQNGSDSGEDYDVAREFLLLVNKMLFKARVFADLHLLRASILGFDFFNLLSLLLLDLLDPFEQLISFF